MNLPPDVLARATGPRSVRNRGRGLESLILASQSDSTVLLTKIPHAAQYIPGGRTVAKRGPVDFAGVYIPTVRPIWFDAKQSQNRNRLSTSVDHLPEHQRLELIRYGGKGCIAGLLCECTPERKLYWCDWRLLIPRLPSIPWDCMWSIGSSALTINWRLIAERPVTP